MGKSIGFEGGKLSFKFFNDKIVSLRSVFRRKDKRVPKMNESMVNERDRENRENITSN